MNDDLKSWKSGGQKPGDAPQTVMTPSGNGAPAKQPEAAAPEKEEETHPSRTYAARRGIRDRGVDIEFRFKSPEQPDLAADYTLLKRVLWHKKTGMIELRFMDGLTVRIHGINLMELKEKIRLRRVTWVREQGQDAVRQKAAEQQLGTEFMWVERIGVEDEDAE